MRLSRIVTIFGVGVALALTGTAVYETYAVWQAHRKTPNIIGAALEAATEVSLTDLSQRRRDILLAVEDPGFFQHRGVDLSSPGQGMTTITQALVKSARRRL